jgi:chromosome segregation protein
MELKNLKIFGFKSFPDEIKFELEPGITAIVGPNGCGKSNIVEAIRWTLGEQSVHSLRADTAEQLIFNGSQTRKPLGIAEVSLTLSNPDYSNIAFPEITITRRLFRSGMSEYFINKTPCRLKDITEVFMDTGLGVNAYSMMSQEQVEMILNAKPEERRLLFEEAAGITKYSRRKNEALRKLELTRQNLARIQDIISELERQSNSLKRQVSKARRYQSIKDELKNLRVVDAFYQYEKLKGSKSEIDKKIENLGKEGDSISNVFEKEEESLKKLQAELAKLEEDIEEKREEQLNLAAEVERNNSVIVVNEERIKDLSRNSGDLTIKKTGIEDELKKVSEDIQNHAEKSGINVEEEEQLQSSIEEYSKRVPEILSKEKEKEKELEEKNSQLIEYLSRKAHIKNALESSKINIHNLEVRLRKLADEKEEIAKKKLAYKKDLDVKKEEVAKNRISNEKLDAEIKSLEKKQLKHKDSINDVEKKLVSLRTDRQMRESRLSGLKEIQARDEGIQDSVKFIMDSEAGSNIQGLIFDVLDVPEKLQKAIEVALMDSIQGLIVKDDSVASELIDLLRNKERGRATFLPINNIKVRKSKRDAGYELAIDKVKFPKQFAGVFSYLLNNVVITKNWKEAMKLYSSLPENFKIITLTGDLLHPGGLIHGGSKKGMQVLIGRRERIEKLEKELDSLKKRLSEMEQRKKSVLADIDNFEKGLKEKRENLFIKIEENSKLEKEIGALTENVEELYKRDKFLAKEQKNIEKEKDSSDKKNQEYKEKLEKIEKNIGEHNLVVDAIKNACELLKKESKEIGGLLEEAKIKLLGIKQSRGLAKEKFAALEERKEILTKEISDIETEIKETNKKVESLKEEVKENGEKLSEQRKRIDFVKEHLKDSKEERIKLNEKCREKEKLIREKESQLSSSKDSLNSLQIEKTRLETEMKDLKDNISATFSMSLDEFSPKEEKIEENIQEKIEQLRGKLERMGNVNLAAIEEEEELNERYNFYLNQQKDLLDSEQSLQDTIKKINSTARSLFKSTLNSVRKEFKEVFGSIFQGGEADLKLVDSQDVLEAGVDMVVSPPGKKLASISLLSGGERAMTAIALLFALFRVKPSPFCVLDEVDASLDEPNIERFTKFLKDLAKDTQFIMISHNKKTLTISEVLYGVTMEEPGVSRLVSVKFKNKSTPSEIIPPQVGTPTEKLERTKAGKNVAQKR